MNRRVLSMTSRREVLLFGLSANPPTGLSGHMGVVSHCRSLYDEIWLLPVYQHIYSNKRQLAPFHHRVEMCRLALQSLTQYRNDGAQLKVVEEEREMFESMAAKSDCPEQLRLGSIDLVQFLLEKHPDTSFTMLLGGDTHADLLAGKWKRGDELMQLDTQDRVTYINVPQLSDVSSTMVRGTADRALLEKCLDSSVLEYIEKNKLYAFVETEEEEN
ncbi:hypothetical protein BBO99_00001232 [Phytophthora kernoviae]|uniref:Cytidyltransferase-like domain-containing protein n=2 Tax=Phytophthora kernoviae TaxID=325452 RepID=A0A3R7H234_9STRA|nr:hypothetical protein G195_005362 [Phytophthora kernoviae 00238/432]KAG2525218.1 hypothetical protein JM16_004555 [Phytophthora kernoviae]KAG2526842.1 hypothetical protein JM18_004131 [Phytophthora kernoviae]RLN14868.1 hypothetical protein BBI17_004639 [Phytophthora kernoviae]RLN84557.1 hypothetical protein BBO99_00001232 [Phytophthora kernoviae]